MQKRHVVRNIREFFHVRVHREKHLDYVAGLPRLSRRHVARRVRLFHDGIAVHDDLKGVFLHPVRMADFHVETAATRNGKLRRFSLREGRFLLDCHALRFPVQKRSRKQVYIQTRFILRVDELVVLRGIFHTRTHAAPHGCIHLGIHPIMTGTCRSEVHVPAMFRVYSGKDVVK